MSIDWRKINSFGRSASRAAEQDSTADTAAATGPGGDDDAAGVAERRSWAVRQVWITRGIRAAFLAAVLAGVVALVLTVVGQAGSPAAVTRPAEVPEPVDTAAAARAGEFATRFVVAWLQAARGQESEIGRYVTSAGDVSLPAVAQFSASEASVASIEAIPGSLGMWSVTVAVNVRPAVDQSTFPVRRYFLAPVVVTSAGVRVATLPAEVAAPASDITVHLGYRYRLSSQAPIVASAGAFLSAMLTGTGDVARYLTPGVSVAAVSPPPYRAVTITTALSSVELTTIDPQAVPVDGEVVRLLVTAAQKTTSGDAVPGQFALTMISRGGRWEVAGMDSSPLLPSDDAADPVATTSAAPTAPAVSAPALAPTGSLGPSAPAPTSSAPAAVPLFSVPGAGPTSVSPEGE